MKGVTGGTRSANEIICELHADMCKIFSHPTRLRILEALRNQEICVNVIADKLNVDVGTVSPHLLMMKRRGVLLSRRDKNRVFYRLAAPRMLEAFDLIREILSERISQQARIVGKKGQQ